jgi:hypothetical protein
MIWHLSWVTGNIVHRYREMVANEYAPRHRHLADDALQLDTDCAVLRS